MYESARSNYALNLTSRLAAARQAGPDCSRAAGTAPDTPVRSQRLSISRWRVYSTTAVLLLCVAACSAPTDGSPAGQWGSQQASLILQPSGGTVTYQCGAGTVDSTWSVDSDGQWLATGTHYFGGGPEPAHGRTPHPARYTGQLHGNRLDFTVNLTDLGQTLGPFHLVRDGPAVSEVCL